MTYSFENLSREEQNAFIDTHVMRHASGAHPPNYMGNLAIAWTILDASGPMVGTHVELWCGSGSLVRVIIRDYPVRTRHTLSMARSPAQALCHAVLHAMGLLDEHEQVCLLPS